MRVETAWGFHIWIILLQTAPVISGREHSASWGDFGSQAFDMGAYKHEIWIYNSNNVFTCAKKSSNKRDDTDIRTEAVLTTPELFYVCDRYVLGSLSTFYHK